MRNFLVLFFLASTLAAQSPPFPPFLTEEDANQLYPVFGDLVVPSAELSVYSPPCTPNFPVSADPSNIQHITGMTNGVNPFIIGTIPADGIGSAISVSDASLATGARIEIDAAVVVITSINTTAEMVVTVDAKVSDVAFNEIVVPFDGTAGQRRSITVANAIRNVGNGALIRIGFRSTGSAAGIQVCKASLSVRVDHAL